MNLDPVRTLAAPTSHEALPLADLHQLIPLAARRSPPERQTLLLGLADIYQTVGGEARAPVGLTEIFTIMVREAEQDIRRALSERLADAAWAPVSLIRELAADAVEIARPVIAASPLLNDADLLHLLCHASRDHQIQIALRPGLPAPVGRAILDAADPAVMTALAANRTARLDQGDITRLVDKARTVAALRAPLTRHPGLSETLALRLYQWVGEALKQAICQRFSLDEARLAEAVAHASDSAMEDNQEQAAARLAAKLHAADQLRPAALIRALREDRLPLFLHALSLLSRLDVEMLRRALQADSARPLFLACMAAGLDRAALPALLGDVRRLNEGRPLDRDGADARPAQRPAAQAAYEFRRLIGPDADVKV
ncbi:DUF2336 domain-containing protein [Brevundimonas diminuta]|uniref:DUF2336 domain-containing protein n=1 Tax=Brevundimonas diminuta TaxID=293 RepID=UPI003D069B02